MNIDDGTGGIAHEIHVAREEDGGLTDFRTFENVVDAMNLPDGSVKFHYEGDLKVIEGGRIVRTTVQGIEEAFRYRCTECLVPSTDVIVQSDRGDRWEIECAVCEIPTDHKRMDINEI